VRTISNQELSLVHLPGPHSPMVEWYVFASSFDGYGYCGEFETIAALSEKIELAYRENPSALSQFSMSELRANLFFEERRFENFDRDPDEIEFRLWKSMLEEIEKKIRHHELG
jgi:hypothetical protein